MNPILSPWMPATSDYDFIHQIRYELGRGSNRFFVSVRCGAPDQWINRQTPNITGWRQLRWFEHRWMQSADLSKERFDVQARAGGFTLVDDPIEWQRMEMLA